MTQEQKQRNHLFLVRTEEDPQLALDAVPIIPVPDEKDERAMAEWRKQSFVLLRIWVCPTPGCGNYQGSSADHDLDLTQEKARPRAEDRWEYEQAHGRDFKHMRSECPDCRDARRGTVQRVLKLVVVQL